MIVSCLALMMIAMSSLAGAIPVMADAYDDGVCNDSTIPEETKKVAGCSETRNVGNQAEAILNTVSAATGMISVAVLIICGVIMMTAAGDPSRLAKAKKGILYAIIGLVISLLAFAIVNFALSSAFGG